MSAYQAATIEVYISIAATLSMHGGVYRNLQKWGRIKKKMADIIYNLIDELLVVSNYIKPKKMKCPQKNKSPPPCTI